MRLQWLDQLSDPWLATALDEFVGEFCHICDVLPRLAPPTQTSQTCPTDANKLADLEWALEGRILRLIARVFGSCRVLAEEYFNRHGQPVGPKSRLSFVLDPLDGSASYARGSDRYASTVGLRLDAKPLVGLVYDPARRCLYSALAGHGAWRDDQPLSRPAEDSPRVVAVRAKRLREPAFARRVRLLGECGYQVERMESTSLKLCWLAQGKRAGVLKWLEQDNGVTKNWGTLAGLLICGEMGLTPLRLSGVACSGESGQFMVADARCLRDLRVRPLRRAQALPGAVRSHGERPPSAADGSR